MSTTECDIDKVTTCVLKGVYNERYTKIKQPTIESSIYMHDTICHQAPNKT